MVNRLTPIDIVDFTGGINLHRSQFQLADNESPDLLNVDIDASGGFASRKGWQRWNINNIVDPTTTAWEPRNAYATTHATNRQDVYVVNNHIVYYSEDTAVFSRLGTVVANANPHGADFATWGSDVYIALGMTTPTVRASITHTVTAMTSATWSEVDAPTHNTVPCAEYIEGHAGYLFTAVMQEAGVNYFARLRWSHPGVPDAWRTDDYLDIDSGGGRITNLMSFQDHLLIFKTDSIWALYGYDEDSWQLVKVSTSSGCPGPQGCTRSETAVYYFSSSDRGGIYGYNGNQPMYLTERLRPAFEETLNYDNVFVSWAGQRLWVGLPWLKDVGSTVNPTTAFVFDPSIGQAGAWTMYRSDLGAIGPVLDGADVNSKYPMAALWSQYAAILVILDYIDGGYDAILEETVLSSTAGDIILTGDGKQIEVTGEAFVGDRFESYYRTRWLHAGWPDRRKSWRRPTFICRQVNAPVDLIIETYRDYNETQIQRSRTLHLRSVGTAYWTTGGASGPDVGGFDWSEEGLADPSGRGANWGATQAGSTMQRAGSQGLARSVQMKVRASPLTPLRKWGVDGIVAKIVMRRFR